MSTQMNANMIEILLVDDDPGDVRLTVEALKQTKMLTNLSFARDGIEALAFLRRQGSFAAAPCPDIIDKRERKTTTRSRNPENVTRRRRPGKPVVKWRP